MNDSIRLSHTTIALHWLVGLAFVVALGLGFYMASTDSWHLMPLHKSLGVAVFCIALLRIIWRAREGWPQPIAGEVIISWQKVAARVIHWLLILATITIPLTGIIASIASGRGLAVFGSQWVASVPNPNVPDKFIPYYADLAHFSMETHESVVFIILALLLLHLGAALKSHFIDKSGILVRMLGKRR